MDDFRKSILKVNSSRIHSITNSRGVYDAYKWIRKNKWLNIPRPVTEHEFYTIIRSVNKYFANSLLQGEDIILPCRLGKIELRKYTPLVTFKDGKLKANLPIDWDKTLKFWSEDEEAYNNRTLIKMEEKEIFKIFYNKRTANYRNKAFYSFEVNKTLRKELKLRIKNKLIDAFVL